MYLLLVIVLVKLAFAQTLQLIEEGKDYFEGKKPFKNRGPACITCHSIKSLGIKGGSIGPDLSRVYISGYFTNFNKNGVKLKQFLKAPTTSTMRAVWLSNPLIDREIEALTALLIHASEKEISNDGPSLISYETTLIILLILGLTIVLYITFLKKR